MVVFYIYNNLRFCVTPDMMINRIDLNYKRLHSYVDKYRRIDELIKWVFCQPGTSRRCFEPGTREYKIITKFVRNGDFIIIQQLRREFEDYCEDLVKILPVRISSITIRVSQIEGCTYNALLGLKNRTRATIKYVLDGHTSEFEDEI